MKIPDNYPVFESYGMGSRIRNNMETAATLLMIKYGVFINTQVVYFDDKSDRVKEFLFEVDGHTFGSLKDLEKALENKAFL